MGLDFGAKTVGVAISDPLFITAQGIEIIRRKEDKRQNLPGWTYKRIHSRGI